MNVIPLSTRIAKLLAKGSEKASKQRLEANDYLVNNYYEPPEPPQEKKKEPKQSNVRKTNF